MNSAVKWLFQVPGKRKGYVLLLALLQAAAGSMGVLYALLLRSIVDSAVSKDAAAFTRNVLWIILLVCVQLALNALVRHLRELTACELENCFKRRLAENILYREYAAVSGTHSGDWMNRMTSDTRLIADSYVDIFPGLTGMAVRLVSALTAVIVLDSWFAWILIPGGAALLFLTWTFRKVLKRLHKDIREQDGRLRVFLQERIESLLMLKSFAAEAETLREAEEYMARHKASRMKRNLVSNLCNTGFGAAMRALVLLGVVYCAHGIMTGSVTYGVMIAVMQLIGQVQSPLANISGYLPRYYAMLASAERLMEIEAFAPDMEGEAATAREAARLYRERFRSVELRHVSFAYPDGPTVLNDISVAVEKGAFLALTGHSGCGKSTLLKLLLCMYRPREGDRCLRFTDGTEQALTAAWRRLFAYVPQGNILINGTIRDAVCFADPTARDDEERIRKALRIACAEEFVSALESGVDTLLGEHGAGLSEGQLQRLAIARAVFSESPILLLDEATSALDGETEAQLLINLRRLTDRTVVIVTHRAAALSVCDRVLEFTEGQIRQRGEASDN